MTQQAHSALDRERPKRTGSDTLPETQRAGSQPPGQARGGPAEAETVDRDAMHQADYGGTREKAPPPDVAQQGGAATDDAGGGGREPTLDRDRDYDPDGDRTGL